MSKNWAEKIAIAKEARAAGAYLRQELTPEQKARIWARILARLGHPRGGRRE